MYVCMYCMHTYTIGIYIILPVRSPSDSRWSLLATAAGTARTLYISMFTHIVYVCMYVYLLYAHIYNRNEYMLPVLPPSDSQRGLLATAAGRARTLYICIQTYT